MKHFTKHLLVLALALAGGFGYAGAEKKTITISYNSTFEPTLPSASESVNKSATAHTVNGLSIKEAGIYKGSSANYLMFAENKGYLYNTESLGTIKSVSVTYSSGASAYAKAGVYFGSTEQSTYTTTSNQIIKGASYTETWTNSTSGNGFFQLSTSNKNCQITQIEITYEEVVITPDGTVATPIFSTSTGTYNEAQSVSLTCATNGATIYYTTDGSTPTTSSSVYSSAISVNTTATTIKAYAVKDGLTDSDVATATYTLVPSTPEITNSGSMVTITSSTGAAIYYTTDGSTPSEESNPYSEPFSLETSPTTVKAIAYGFGSSSEVASKENITFATGTIIWSEDFTNYNAGDVPASGTYATYTIVDGGSDTKIYNEKLANGTSPELLIGYTAKGKSGSMTATINLRRYYGNMTLVFKSNNPAYLEIKSTTKDVIIGEEVNDNTEKTKTVPITVPEGTAELVLKITNNNSKNARVDNFELYATSRSNPSISITSAGYATYCTDVALDFTGTGLTAYVASVSYGKVAFTPVTKVPANTGILLKGAKGPYSIPAAESADPVSNALVGVTTAAEQSAGIYVLMNGGQGVGFYKTNNAFTVGANTAYLPASVAGAKVRFISFDGKAVADAIEAIAAEDVNASSIYNLSGTRLSSLQKGINILHMQNGETRKVVVK